MGEAGAAPRGDLAALRFLVAASAWTVGLFALLRAPWTEAHLLGPLAGAQEAAARYGLSGPARVTVTLDCAGADVMACLLYTSPSPRD